MVGDPDRGTPHGVPSEGDAAVRVLICDDQEVLRHGLRTVLRWAPGFLVVAEAAGAEEALALAAGHRPDVALVGLRTQGLAEHDLVRALTALGSRVVLLGDAGASSDLIDALRAGARGYLHTTVSRDRMIEVIGAVAAGETVLDAAVTGELLSRLDEARGELPAARPSPSLLTARQRAVSELVAEGLTNAEIAERLEVSRATVKGHITVALRRLGLRDRTQLAIYLHRAGQPGTGQEAGPLSG